MNQKMNQMEIEEKDLIDSFKQGGYTNDLTVDVSEKDFVKYILPVISGRLKMGPNFTEYIKSLDKEYIPGSGSLYGLIKDIRIINHEKKVIGILPSIMDRDIINVGGREGIDKVLKVYQAFKQNLDSIPSKSSLIGLEKSLENNYEKNGIEKEKQTDRMNKILKIINIYYPNFTLENKDFSTTTKQENKLENNANKKEKEWIDPNQGFIID